MSGWFDSGWFEQGWFAGTAELFGETDGLAVSLASLKNSASCQARVPSTLQVAGRLTNLRLLKGYSPGEGQLWGVCHPDKKLATQFSVDLMLAASLTRRLAVSGNGIGTIAVLSSLSIQTSIIGALLAKGHNQSTLNIKKRPKANGLTQLGLGITV